MSTIPIRDVLNAGRSSNPAAINDIATTEELWISDSPASPTKMTAAERAELVQLMVKHAQQNHPAALFRVGCCFYHSEVFNENFTAAQKCWFNAHELLEARIGGMFGLIFTHPDDRLAMRLLDKCARKINAAQDYLRTEGLIPLKKLQSGELFDLSEYLPNQT